MARLYTRVIGRIICLMVKASVLMTKGIKKKRITLMVSMYLDWKVNRTLWPDMIWYDDDILIYKGMMMIIFSDWICFFGRNCCKLKDLSIFCWGLSNLIVLLFSTSRRSIQWFSEFYLRGMMTVVWSSKLWFSGLIVGCQGLLAWNLRFSGGFLVGFFIKIEGRTTW